MPYGTVNADVIGTSVTGSNLGAGNASIMKNRIINGAMVIDQRNAGASGTATGYCIDRWSFGATLSTKGTWQQNAGSVTPPAGFTNYLGFTSNSAYTPSSTDVFSFYQVIEGYNIADLGWGTANAKTVTVSFWVRSSLTGTFGGALSNTTRSNPFSFTINSANTWEQKTVTVAGDTSGTWGSTNTAGIYLFITFGAGSTYQGTAGTWATADYRTVTGAVNTVGTNGATFYITGVQLEVGSSATGYEYRNYQQELAMCQRYYWRSTSGAAFPPYGYGWMNNSSGGYAVVNYPVPMRAAATTLDYSTLGVSVLGISTGAVSSASINSSTLYLAQVSVTSSATFPTGFAVLTANNSASSYIGFGAEL